MIDAPEGISTLVFTGGRLLVAGPGGGAIIELADASSIACPQLKSEASVLPAGLVMTVNPGEAGYDLVDIDGPTCRREAKNQFPALALAQVATTSDGLFVAGRLSSVEGSSGVARLGDGKSLWEAGAGGLFASLDGLGVCGDDLCVLDASNAQLVRLSQTSGVELARTALADLGIADTATDLEPSAGWVVEASGSGLSLIRLDISG